LRISDSSLLPAACLSTPLEALSPSKGCQLPATLATLAPWRFVLLD
jgi:hypothetical protein